MTAQQPVRHHREYSTSGLAVSFAAQGVAVDAIARAMVVGEAQILSTVTHAYEIGVLAAMPPLTSGDVRSAMRSELINLRAQLRDMKDLVGEISKGRDAGIADLHGVAGLTWKEATIVHAFMTHGRLSKDRLYHEVYGGFGADEQPEPKIIDVFICKIRKKLLPLGVRVVTHWGFGYGMSAADVAAMRELAGAGGTASGGRAEPRAGNSVMSFQFRVLNWLMACFSMEICRDTTERNHRFLEESLELVQSTGCTRSEAHQLVDYVFDRPVGEPFQEVGGVAITFSALCSCIDISQEEAGEAELARISRPEVMEKVRAKQAAKPKHSPLPEAA